MAKDLYYYVSILAGSAQYDMSHDLSSFTINEANGKPAELTLYMSDRYKVFSHALQVGMTIEVDIGSVEEHSLIFRGKIDKVASSFPVDGIPTLKLLAHDASMAMGLRKRNRAFIDKKLSNIVKEVGSAFFDPGSIIVDLSAEGDPTFSGNGIRQREKTDLHFLNDLATQYGCEMFVVAEDNTDKLYFKSQYNIMKAEPDVTLYHGRCDADRLLSFDADSALGNIQLPRVLSGMNYETGEPTEVTTTKVEKVGDTDDEFQDENMTEFRQDHPVRAAKLTGLLLAAASVQQEIQAQLGEAERHAIPTFTSEEEQNVIAANQYSISIHGMRANGNTDGNQRMHAHSNIEIANVGGRFSGTWYLSEVTHRLNEQGYKTEFQCQR